jgi:hypothetical protein
MRPEDPVKCAHCSAVVLYVFFRDSAKSPFFMSMNNHVRIHCIYPQFHWAVRQDILNLEIKLILSSHTYVFRKKLICGETDRVKIVIQPSFPPSRPEESRETLYKISEMQ